MIIIRRFFESFQKIRSSRHVLSRYAKAPRIHNKKTAYNILFNTTYLVTLKYTTYQLTCNTKPRSRIDVNCLKLTTRLFSNDI